MIVRLVLAALVAVATPSLAGTDDIPLQPHRWAQEYVGRTADPAVHFGRLPNGLRFAIMRNTTPEGQIAMRLRIDSGFLAEQDDERGAAHYLEHLAFRGSRTLADGEIVRRLQTAGLRFGLDTNAMTGASTTTYMFNFPTSSPGTVDLGLHLFREIADGLTLSPEAVASERGVILSEQRVRDTPQLRVSDARIAAILSGSRLANRPGIGTIAQIQRLSAMSIRRFYERNYVPGNATIVIVGDVDPAEVERQLTAAFQDWSKAGEVPTVDLGIPDRTKAETSYVAPGIPTVMELAWPGAPERRAPTESNAADALARNLAVAAINQRLADLAATDNSPLVRASVSITPDFDGLAKVAVVQIVPAVGRDREALDLVIPAFRDQLAQGVSEQSYRRAVTVFRTGLTQVTAQTRTLPSQLLAEKLLAAASGGGLFTSPGQELQLFERLLPSMSRAKVDAQFRRAFEGRPVLYRAGSPETMKIGMLAAVDHAWKLPTARASETVVKWPYDQAYFGQPGSVTHRDVNAKLGTTRFTFSNGTTLTLKRTAFSKGQVSVAVALGNGRSGLSTKDAKAIWAISSFPVGGTGKLSRQEIAQWTQSNGVPVGLTIGAGYREFELDGSVPSTFLLQEMQLMAAYVRDPGFRSQQGDAIRKTAQLFLSQGRDTPARAFADAADLVKVGGDRRFGSAPADEDFANTSLEDVKAILQPALSGSADIIMVGDVDEAAAIAATQTTFAAGKPARATAQVAEPRVTFNAGGEPRHIALHKGRADQGIAGLFFAIPDYLSDPPASEVGDVVAAVLESRLVDSIREKLGLTYSPDVIAIQETDLRGSGYFSATVEIDPKNFERFESMVRGEIASLAATPLNADELERARRPAVEAARKRLLSNSIWRSVLADSTRNPPAADRLVDQPARTARVTAQDVMAYAKGYLNVKAPIIVESRTAELKDRH